ncbi:hypothetical protein GCM10025734_69590 [Kitasatospora paranensis]
MTAPVVVLVGPPGSGKSTVGRLVAERLGVAFRDTDADIEELAGKPIPEIFIDEGEPHFRDLEVRAVRAAAEEHTGVLALGGGAVMAGATREALAPLPVVFLEVPLADAVKRVGLDAPGRSSRSTRGRAGVSSWTPAGPSTWRSPTPWSTPRAAPRSRSRTPYWKHWS